MRMRRGLIVKINSRASRGGERLELLIGRLNHEMRFERQAGVLAGRRHDVGPERDVGHELTVHDVPLDPVGARRLQRGDLVPETGEISRQHRGHNEDRAAHHPFTLPVRPGDRD